MPQVQRTPYHFMKSTKELCVFLLNNVRDYNHKKEYPQIPGVIFDIGESQLKNKMNYEPWEQIKPGDIAAIIRSDRKFYLFYVVDCVLPTDIERENDRVYVITGRRVAKLANPISMQTLLNKNKVEHPYLPAGQFRIGFNIGNLGNSLDAVELKKTEEGDTTIGMLKARYMK